MKILVRWLLLAAALLLVAYLYPGVQVQSFGSALIAAAVALLAYQAVYFWIDAPLHYITDHQEAEQVIQTFKDAIPSGSYLTVGVWTYDDAPRDVMEKYAEMTKVLTTPGAPRPREKVIRYFDGFELVEPGLVHSPLWRPDGPDDLALDDPGRSVTWVGVARKP